MRDGVVAAPDERRPRLSVAVVAPDARVPDARCRAALDAACARIPGCERIVVLPVHAADADLDAARAVGATQPDVRVLRVADGSSFAATANAALDAARGAIVWLLRSDVEVAPDAAEHLLAAFDANPWLGVAGPALRSSGGAPLPGGGAAPGSRTLLLLELGVAAACGRAPGRLRVADDARVPAVEVDWVADAALALRRAAWLRTGTLDTRLRACAPAADLCLRARTRGWQVGIVPGAIVTRHDPSATERRAATRAARDGAAPALDDVVRLASRHHGATYARRVRRLLLAGAALRHVLRRAATPFVQTSRAAGWRRDTAALAAELAALRGLDPASLDGRSP